MASAVGTRQTAGMATVLLTGASGFLGAHTIQHLLESGHEVRTFVRTPARLGEALRPLGVDPEDKRIVVAQGDMTDVGAVRAAVEGCDSVVHAAATYSFKRRDRGAMLRDNTAGTRAVLEAGRDAGCRTLVHVSSTVALATPGGATLDERSPVGPGHGPYSTSKAASEEVARELQEAGAPVTIVNPGGVIGPDDPYLGESNAAVRQVLMGKLPIYPRGLQHYVDVRDTAAVLAAAVDHAPGGRYLVPGEGLVSMHEYLGSITGRKLPVRLVPAGLAAASAMPGYLTGWDFLPGAVEGARISGCANAVDSSTTTRDLGVRARPMRDALTDTVRWLVTAGHLPAKLAGQALPA